jgi:hypothetical protein
MVVCVICRQLSALSENTRMSWFLDYWPLYSGRSQEMNDALNTGFVVSICLSVCWWAGMSPWKQVKAF